MENKPIFKVGYTELPADTSRKAFRFHQGPSNTDMNLTRCKGWLKSEPNDSAYSKVDPKYSEELESTQILDDYLAPAIPQIVAGETRIETSNCYIEVVKG